MLCRIATAIAVAALMAPGIGLAHDWEEDYTDAGRLSESLPPSNEYPVSVDVDAPPPDIAMFQRSLAPYGEWVVVSSYGRVWRPHVSQGWRPYYYGRWEWTNEGWLWVSDEPFGWAAYHYGRWSLDPRSGWVWVPGYEWAPAWVSWRYSGEVVGWAPLGPGVSIYVEAMPYAEGSWTFVPCRSFVAEPVYRVAYEPARAHQFFLDTLSAPARPGFRKALGRSAAAPAWGGPPPRAIEERIGRPITPVRVVASPSPGRGTAGPGEVAIFRPGIRPAPGEVAGGPGSLRLGDARPRPTASARESEGRGIPPPASASILRESPDRGFGERVGGAYAPAAVPPAPRVEQAPQLGRQGGERDSHR